MSERDSTRTQDYTHFNPVVVNANFGGVLATAVLGVAVFVLLVTLRRLQAEQRELLQNLGMTIY